MDLRYFANRLGDKSKYEPSNSDEEKREAEWYAAMVLRDKFRRAAARYPNDPDRAYDVVMG